MGNYIVQADIENVFGAVNVAIWSNLDNDSEVADTDRIASAILYGEEEVDNFFRGGKYNVPIVKISGSGCPAVVTDWASKLAGIWLYESRGHDDSDKPYHKFTKMKSDVMKSMDGYMVGSRKMAARIITSSEPTAPVVVM